MAKLFPSTSITGAVSKFVELDGAFAILGGQIYLSAKTTVVPFSFLPIYSSDECESTMRHYCRVPASTMTYGENVRNGVYLDSYVPDTSYVTFNSKDATKYGIHKIKKDGNKYYKSASWSPTTAYSNDLDIVAQDEKYLYVLAKNQQTATYASMVLYKVRKDDMSLVTSCIVNTTGLYMNGAEIYRNIIGGKIYGFQVIKSTGKVNFFAIDVSTMTVTNYTGTTVYTNTVYSIGELFENNGKLTGYVHLNTNSIIKFDFNLSTNAITETVAATFDYTRTALDAGFVMTKCIPINKSSILLIQKPMRSETSILDNRVISFKINTDGTLTLVNALNMGANIWKTYMVSATDSLLFLCGSTNIDVVALSTDTDFTLRKLQSIPVSDLHTFAKDSYGRYYMMNKDTSFDFFNVEIPIAIEAAFDKSITPYKGIITKVANNLTVKLYNHIGQLCNGTLQITAVGPCEFSDGSKVKNVTTMNGSVTIPFNHIGTGITSFKIKNL